MRRATAATRKRSRSRTSPRIASPVMASAVTADAGVVHGRRNPLSTAEEGRRAGESSAAPTSAHLDAPHTKDCDKQAATASSRWAKWLAIVVGIATAYGVWFLWSRSNSAPGEAGPVANEQWRQWRQVETVWWYAWITAASSALGAVPLLLVKRRQSEAEGQGESSGSTSLWLGVGNAGAAGMMLAASALLGIEGIAAAASMAAVHTGGGSTGAVVASSAAGGGGAAAGAALVDDPFGAAGGSAGAGDASATWLSVAAASYVSPALPVAVGVALGCAFIYGSKAWLERHETLRLAGFHELSASHLRRALLIVAVMTLHSAAEGIGLGVAFSHHSHGDGTNADAAAAVAAPAPATAAAAGKGEHVGELGLFLSAALALHNVPEGLAICLVLVPRGVPVLEAALWAIATSLTQPLLAVPAFLSVQLFASLLPYGLGFAAGAMTWLAVAELLVEATEALGSKTRAGAVAGAAALLMVLLQESFR